MRGIFKLYGNMQFSGILWAIMKYLTSLLSVLLQYASFSVTEVLEAFAKLLRATTGVVASVCLSVRMGQLGSY